VDIRNATHAIGQRLKSALHLHRQPEAEPHDQARGLLVIQLDGLSHRDLQTALQRGLMPNLKQRLDSGAMLETPFHSGLPSQTAVVQGGFLCGSSTLPTNQWYDKDTGRVMNVMGPDAPAVESNLLAGHHGLLHGGSCFMSTLDGDASQKTFTVSGLEAAKEAHGVPGALPTLGHQIGRLAWGLALHPFAAVRSFAEAAGISVRDAYRRHKNHIPDHGKQRITNPFMTGFTLGFVADGAARVMSRQMKKGVPVTFVDFPSFDDHGHCFGPNEYAFQSLKHVDRNLGIMLKAAEKNHYNVVMLSDHGHIFGSHFSDRYGQTLQDYIKGLLPAGQQVISQDFGPGAQVYFSSQPGSLGRHDVEQRFPGVIDTLKQHDGIAFVVTRDGDATCIDGAKGSVRVDGGGAVTVTGDNPLDAFDGTPADRDRRTQQLHDMAHREHAGDLQVWGQQIGDRTFVDFATNGLRGMHGGIGGGQDEAFLAYSASMPLQPQNITQASHLYDQLMASRNAAG
jgi:hypothetical protein